MTKAERVVKELSELHELNKSIQRARLVKQNPAEKVKKRNLNLDEHPKNKDTRTA